MNKPIFKSLFLVCIVSILSCPLQAKDGYNIKVTINGVKDSMCWLANHFGDKQYIQDSAKADSQGRFKFEGTKTMRGGVYLVVMPNKKFFEIILDKQQFFSIEADTSLNPEKISFKDSPDNTQFYDYLRFNGKLRKEMTPVQQEYSVLKPAEKEKSPLKKKLEDYDNQFNAYRDNIIKNSPKSLLASLLKATVEPKIPEPPKKSDGSIDSNFQYNYYKAHYFDGINWDDARLLRTPVIQSKLDYYFGKLVMQMPDSVNKEADVVVKLAEADTEVFKFTVWFITHKYETSNIMGMDGVFVHMVNNYYTKDKAYWLSEADLYKIRDKAKQTEPILIGKKCRNIVLQDTSGVYQSLYDIKTPYTVLFFWDPDCGHCQKSAPKMVEFYSKMHSKGVEILGVCTEVEMDKWKKFIKEKNLNWMNVADPNMKDNFRYDFDLATTPQIYILDKNKVIIGKKIDAEQLEGFIEHDMSIHHP